MKTNQTNKPINDSVDTKDQNEEIQKQIEEVKQLAEEWKGKYLRALADYQNQERRTADIGRLTVSRAEEMVIGKLLPIIDLFDQIVSLDIYKEDKGLKAVWKQLHDLIEGYGVEKITVVGREFDPHIMECIDVAEVENDKENNMVVKEIAKGYTVRGQLLRPAKVVVGKKSIKI